MRTTSDLPGSVREARTLLFVPGHRPDRFAKAAAAGADLVILDLEDAVAAADKDRARDEVVAHLDGAGPAVVRVNGAGTPWYEADVAALRDRRCAVMVPKAEPGAALEDLMGRLAAGTPVVALVETASGVLGAAEVARIPGVTRLAFGSLDLAAQLDVDPADHAALTHARAAVVIACAAAGLPGPVDGVTPAVDDMEAVREDAEHGRRLGFTAKLCIHPRQLAAVRSVFTPSPARRAWARAVLALADGPVAVLDGQMVDAPVVARALSILATEGDPS